MLPASSRAALADDEAREDASADLHGDARAVAGAEGDERRASG